MSIWGQELEELHARVERLEITVRQLASHDHQTTPPAAKQVSAQQQDLNWLKTEGLIRDPTPEELRVAAQWDSLEEEEKQGHIRLVQSLLLNPPLSRILSENRR
jgi:hypothetical protein